MPFADPEKRRENHKKWMERKMKEGYGKALYARRAHRYKNEETLREGVREALRVLNEAQDWDHNTCRVIEGILERALNAAPEIESPIKYMPKGES